MRRKVLLCAPYKGTIGGISRWTSHIVDFFSENRHKTKVDLTLYSLSRSKNIYANTFWGKRTFWGIVDYISIIRNFKKKISDHNYDVVHIVSSASLSLLKDLIMLRLANKKEISSIIHFRFGRIPQLFQKNNWEKKMLDYVVQTADTVIVIDKQSYDTLIKNGYNNVVYLPNPLSTNVTNFIIENNEIVRDPGKVVFAGHVVSTKGIFELVEAAKNIKGIKLQIVGSVSNEIKKELYGRAGNNSWINLLGECSSERVLSEMLSAGIFVLPSYTEGFPNVILEAMACSCPIIATNVGAIPQMLSIDGIDDCGLLITPKNIIELEEAIKKIMFNKELAERLGKRAHSRVIREYSMQKIWQELESIWLLK